MECIRRYFCTSKVCRDVSCHKGFIFFMTITHIQNMGFFGHQKWVKEF
jgi:hypothetical protein